MPKVIGTVFGLNDVYALLKQNATTGTDDYWPVQTAYGIWVGGVTASIIYTGSGSNRIEFKTETLTAGAAPGAFGASFRGGISDNKQRYGWFIGGVNGPATVTSQICRLEMTSEASSISQNWPAAYTGVSGASNNGYGYGVGGSSGSVSHSVCNKFDYSSETISAIPNLPTSRSLLIHFGDRDYGWFSCGVNQFGPSTTKYSNTAKLDYSTDTFSTSTNHPNTVGWGAGGGTNYYGFTFGGQGPAATSTTTKFDFTNEAYSAGTNMPQARRLADANFDDLYGYLLGGSSPGPSDINFGTLYSNTLRYDFELDTWSLPGSNGSAGCGRGTGTTGGVARVSSRAFNGYYLGGYGATGYKTSITRYDFDSDTYTTLPNAVSAELGGASTQFAVSSSKIYKGGGFSPAGNADMVDTFDMETETVVNDYIQLPESRYLMTGAENAASNYGYLCGGNFISPATYKSNVYKIDVDVDTFGPTTSMPSAFSGMTPSSAPYLGKSYLFLGAAPGAYVSNALKLDWSTETWDNSTNFGSTGFYNCRAFRNNQNSWICPGPYAAKSVMFRWDYSTDTSTTLSPLGVTKRVPAVTWSNYVGYIAGGVYDPTAVRSFDMSTETPSAAPALPTNNSDTGTGTSSNTY